MRLRTHRHRSVFHPIPAFILSWLCYSSVCTLDWCRTTVFRARATEQYTWLHSPTYYDRGHLSGRLRQCYQGRLIPVVGCDACFDTVEPDLLGSIPPYMSFYIHDAPVDGLQQPRLIDD